MAQGEHLGWVSADCRCPQLAASRACSWACPTIDRRDVLTPSVFEFNDNPKPDVVARPDRVGAPLETVRRQAAGQPCGYRSTHAVRHRVSV